MNNSPVIVGLSGYARAGKDTFARSLTKNFNFVQLNMADSLREIALAIDPLISVDDFGKMYYSEAITGYGYDEAKKRFPEFRRFLQRLGTEGMRRCVDENFWVNLWKSKTQQAISSGKSVVVSDVRFLNEAKAIREIGNENSHLWRISRKGVVPANSHESELEFLKIDFDSVINNTSLYEVDLTVNKLMKELASRD